MVRKIGEEIFKNVDAHKEPLFCPFSRVWMEWTRAQKSTMTFFSSFVWTLTFFALRKWEHFFSDYFSFTFQTHTWWLIRSVLWACIFILCYGYYKHEKRERKKNISAFSSRCRSITSNYVDCRLSLSLSPTLFSRYSGLRILSPLWIGSGPYVKTISIRATWCLLTGVRCISKSWVRSGSQPTHITPCEKKY